MVLNKILKESRYIIVDCLLVEDNENQKARLNRLLDLYNMMQEQDLMKNGEITYI